MTGQEINEYSRALGALQATVQHLTQMWEQNDREATEGRHRLYGKVDDLRAEINKLGSRVDRMAERIDEMKPTVDTVGQQHQQNIGSNKAVATIWGALFTLAGAAGALGMKLLEYFWPPKH